MTKLKFKSVIFKSIFYKHFFIFSSCTEMSKNLSVKYYQENKERLQKKLVKDIKVFLKKKKKKRENMVVNITKISQKMKTKSLLSIEKILQNEKKCLIIIIKNYYFKK